MSLPIDAAYHVFAGYGPHVLRDADPQDCSAGDATAERISEALSKTPLAGVPEAELLDYFYLAIIHIGTVADFKHFLPRILELMSAPSVAPAILLDKFKDASFHTWPPGEQRVVRGCIQDAPKGTPLARLVGRL